MPGMPRKKHTSKRIPANHRYKIEKRVKDHHRKLRKDAKSNPKGQHKNKKDPGIPNNYPFKEQLLQQIADAKLKAQEEKDKAKEERRKAQEKVRKAAQAKARAEAIANGTAVPAEKKAPKKKEEVVVEGNALSKASKRKAAATAATSGSSAKKAKTAPETKKASKKAKEVEEVEVEDAPYDFGEHFTKPASDAEEEDEEEDEE